MKRILALVLMLSITAGVFSGCGTKKQAYVPSGHGLYTGEDTPQPGATTPEKEQELTLAYYPKRSMNPLLSTDATNRTLFSLLYQSLFVVDKFYDVHPMLCKNYSMSSDMTSFTFYLQPATFSDGSPLTAEDVIATYNAARESDLYGGRLSHVIAVYETDGGVTMETDTPYENFFLLLDIPILKASQLKEEKPLGTGPYYLGSGTSGDRLVRRQDWWCSPKMAVTASAINLIVAENPAQIRDAFEFSDVGLVCADPGSDTYADYRCDYELWDVESGTFLYLGFNTQESKVFSNQKVRSAVTHAINRELLVEEFYRGFAVPAYLPASPYSPFYSAGLASRYSYDPDQLSQAVIGAGLQGSKVKLLVNEADSHRVRIAKRIAEMLSNCALDVELLFYSGNDYQYVLSSREYQDPTSGEPGTYDLYLGKTKLAANMDLSAFFRDYGMLSGGGISDTATYALCLDALTNSGNYYNLHERVMEQGFICPILFHNYAVYANRGLLTGLSPARNNIFYYDLGTTMADVQVEHGSPATETESDADSDGE